MRSVRAPFLAGGESADPPSRTHRAHEPCAFPLTRPRSRGGTLSHRMGEGWGEGARFTTSNSIGVKALARPAPFALAPIPAADRRQRRIGRPRFNILPWFDTASSRFLDTVSHEPGNLSPYHGMGSSDPESAPDGPQGPYNSAAPHRRKCVLIEQSILPETEVGFLSA